MILVIGDIMIDDYRIVEVNRVSPEAPCLIGLASAQKSILGGAANVAANIKKLTDNLLLIGKGEKECFQALFEDSEIPSIVLEEKNGHSVKTRFIDKKSNVQLFRYDIENVKLFDSDADDEMVRFFKNLEPDKYQVQVLVDYGKGIFRRNLGIQGSTINLISTKNPKASLLIPKSTGVNILSVNNSEFSALQDYTGYHYIVRTEGGKGLSIFKIVEQETSLLFHVDGIKTEVFDVTGAGDTVLAVVAFCLDEFGFSEKNLIAACECANQAASKVVSLSGTATLVDSPSQIKHHFQDTITMYKILKRSLVP